MARKRRMMATASPMMDEDWRAHEDLRTLTRAGEIARDRARLRAAKAEAKRQMRNLEHVAGGKERRQKSRRERLADVEL